MPDLPLQPTKNNLDDEETVFKDEKVGKAYSNLVSSGQKSKFLPLLS
jgi:hypothetical protein